MSMEIIVENYKKYLYNLGIVETKMLVADLITWLNYPYEYRLPTILYDFICIQNKIETRWETFGKYIAKIYNNKKDIKIIEVGCGPTANLSKYLQENGYYIKYAIDPVVKLLDGLVTIKNEFNFEDCDVSGANLLVAQHPCCVTEDIIWKALDNNIDFCIALCEETHDSRTGIKFNTPLEWWNYLVSISSERIVLEKISHFMYTTYIIRSK